MHEENYMEPQAERKNVLKLNKPFTFEGMEYTEIDLSALPALPP